MRRRTNGRRPAAPADQIADERAALEVRSREHEGPDRAVREYSAAATTPTRSRGGALKASVARHGRPPVGGVSPHRSGADRKWGSKCCSTMFQRACDGHVVPSASGRCGRSRSIGGTRSLGSQTQVGRSVNSPARLGSEGEWIGRDAHGIGSWSAQCRPLDKPEELQGPGWSHTCGFSRTGQVLVPDPHR